jgi:sulfate permease, SulP family
VDQAVARSDSVRDGRGSFSGELGGAFADLGVLVPLEAALIAVNGLNPSTTLLGVGIAYIAVGRYYGLPIPVQPLKAFAAIAITAQAAPPVIAAGALWMSALLALLAVTGLIDVLARVVPVGVVRGIQLGLAFLLVKNGWQLVMDEPFLIGGTRLTFEFAGETLPWALPVALAGGAILLLPFDRVPVALVLLVAGALVGFYAASPGTFSGFSLGPASFSPYLPGLSDFLVALPLLVVPQLPLTLGNSVIATSDAARSYFGVRARKVTPRALCSTIAAGNLWAGLAGGLPMCHGCGGLTAHYRLGARTPLATTIVGATLIVVALLFGGAALEARSIIPYAIFGVLLAYVGVEHFRLGWSVPDGISRLLALFTAGAAIYSGGNLAVGAAFGLGLAAIVKGFALLRSRVTSGRL